MPKPTFFNLPDEKREQILDIAIDEFANNDYESVSISRLVARAGIAKGSFYQYFTDKADLYSYLLELLTQKKFEFLSLDRPDPQHAGIFVYLRWMALEGAAFELAYPKLTQIGLRAMNTGTVPSAFYAQARESALAFYRRLVEVGKEQGDIEPYIDPEVAALVFDSVLTGIGRYIFERFADPDSGRRGDRQALFELPGVSDLFTQSVNILEHGMGNRTGESNQSWRAAAHGDPAD
ncbi:MAG: TetR/AcrR family transcriptional regulator [Caldilineaceae bacterium]|nr:TetR/AcrR family transcriptional regulator [Caldilineaceae bacterium]